MLNNELMELGVEVVDLQLGFVQLDFETKRISLSEVEKIFSNNGFEIILNNDNILAEQTNVWIIKYTWQGEQELELTIYLNKNIEKSYQILSRNFSKVFEQTIERYAIKLMIERLKEKISIGKEDFSHIAYSLVYHNPSSLSRQFKKETGLSMRAYKKIGRNDRILLDKIL